MPSFFRLTKNKQFNYIPRYYSEQKEEMKKRKERIAHEIDAEQDSTGEKRIPLMKGQIKNYYLQNSKVSKRQSSIRVLVIIVILLFLAYYLLVK